jgi:DNA-binding MarR family transcriptional regulator
MKPERDETESPRSLAHDIQESLRDLTGRLHQLNEAVGHRIDLREGDIRLVDLIARQGPMTPSELAEHTGTHPATLTGMLDRLEAGNWISRVPDPGDRRRVRIEARLERGGEMARLYGPMNKAIVAICAELSPDQLRVVRDFLQRVSAAGVDATSKVRETGR